MIRLNTILQSSVLTLGLTLLCGCHAGPADYGFLMTHPETLEQEASRCQAEKTTDADCLVVRRAANDFSALVYERGVNPEGFGKKILAAEAKQSELQQALQHAQGGAKQNLQKEYDQLHQNLAVLLAVVAATTGVGA